MREILYSSYLERKERDFRLFPLKPVEDILKTISETFQISLEDLLEGYGWKDLTIQPLIEYVILRGLETNYPTQICREIFWISETTEVSPRGERKILTIHMNTGYKVLENLSPVFVYEYHKLVKDFLGSNPFYKSLDNLQVIL